MNVNYENSNNIYIPREIFGKILEELPIIDIGKYSTVSQLWNNRIRDQQNNWFLQKTPESILNIFGGKEEINKLPKFKLKKSRYPYAIKDYKMPHQVMRGIFMGNHPFFCIKYHYSYSKNFQQDIKIAILYTNFVDSTGTRQWFEKTRPDDPFYNKPYLAWFEETRDPFHNKPHLDSPLVNNLAKLVSGETIKDGNKIFSINSID